MLGHELLIDLCRKCIPGGEDALHCSSPCRGDGNVYGVCAGGGTVAPPGQGRCKLIFNVSEKQNVTVVISVS